MLLELGGVNLNAVNQDDNTALMVASSDGKIEMAQMLHEAKADFNVCGCDSTALHSAAINGHTEMLKVTPIACVLWLFVVISFAINDDHLPCHE